MTKYQVRSKDLIDMVNDIKGGRLILNPYFQRNLVWRDIHKRDFIETILLGYPFPQIFIARGDINVETMTSQSCVVDGQQRMNAIIEYVEGKLLVGGRNYANLAQAEKEAFLTYQIPVIDLEIKATEPAVIDVFQRLNRTFYSLSSIEKMSTEFASTDFMLISKYISGVLDRLDEDGQVELEIDPNMPVEFMPWALKFEGKAFREITTNGRIFTGYENSRLVHLMWTLNLLATIRTGFFSRNDKTKELLENAADQTPNRDRLISVTEQAAKFFLGLELPLQSIWWNKSNSFSLMVVLIWHLDALEAMGQQEVKSRLLTFSEDAPADYNLATREGVNNTQQRKTRHDHLARIFELPTAGQPFEN
jgi:Protein of unknown function DUF262